MKTIADVFGTTTNVYSDWSTRTTDPLGNTKDMLSDAYGNLVGVGEKLQSGIASTTYAWDLNKKLTKIADALGNVRNFTYDNLGRLTLSEDLHTPADTTFGTTTRVFDDANNVIQIINPRGQTINSTFDALNRPLTEDFTGLSGTEVQYTYDTCTNGKGRLCTVKKQGEATTTYLYGPTGLTTDEGKTIGLGSTQSTATTSFTYLRNGAQDRITYPDAAQVYNLYDSAGLLDIVLSKESSGATTSVVTRMTWTPTEQIEAQDFGNGVTSTSTYDKTKKYRLTNKYAKGSAVLQDLRYTYDAVGNITILDEEASTTGRKTVLYTYDPLYRLLTASTTAVATGTAGYSQTFSYDALGNLQTGPAGTYTYGQTGYANPDAVTALAGASYLYDQSGNLTSSGSSTYAWDYNNRMATATVVTSSTTITGAGGTTTITFDASSTSITTGFNGGPITKTWSQACNGCSLVVLMADLWQDVGPIGTITSATDNGVSFTRIATTTAVNIESEMWYFVATSTGNQNISVTVTGATDAIKLGTASFKGTATSSPLDVSATVTGGSGNPSASVTTGTAFDAVVTTLSRFSTTAATSNRTKIYNDVAGSTLAAGSYQFATATGAYSDTYSGSVGQDWSMVIAAFKPGSSTSTGSTTVTYSTTTVTYLYDHSGDRVQMKDSTTTQYWGKFYQQTPNGYSKTKQIYVNGALVATLDKKGTASVIPYYVITDNLGGSSLLTNASGTATQTIDYFPFGDIRANAKNTSFDEPRKYIGQINDTATNLDYLNARYYDARRGQFTGEDPVSQSIANVTDNGLLSNPQDQNYYSYALNNPINKSDPSGLAAESQYSSMAVQSAINAYKIELATITVGTARSFVNSVKQFVGGVVDPYAGYKAITNNALSTPEKFGAGVGTAVGSIFIAKDIGVATVRRGWALGEDIYKATAAGNKPSWSTIRARFWKNAATDADSIEQYGAENVNRMQRGLAPQRYNEAKGGMESKELSHEPIPKRDGGTQVVPRWPQEHANVDPFRYPGY